MYARQGRCGQRESIQGAIRNIQVAPCEFGALRAAERSATNQP